MQSTTGLVWESQIKPCQKKSKNGNQKSPKRIKIKIDVRRNFIQNFHQEPLSCFSDFLCLQARYIPKKKGFFSNQKKILHKKIVTKKVSAIVKIRQTRNFMKEQLPTVTLKQKISR